jgi:thioredoxin-like negative regulator of GroEL
MHPRLIIVVLVTLSLFSCEKAAELVRQWKPAAKSAASASPVVVAPPPATPAAPAGPVVVNLQPAAVDHFVATQGRLMVLVFHASWCGPCKRLGPVISSVAAESDGLVNIGRIDVDQAPELASKLGVSSIPDVRLYRDGVEVDRFVGGRSAADLRARFESLTRDLKTQPAPSASAAVPAASPGVVEPMKKDWLPPGFQRR